MAYENLEPGQSETIENEDGTTSVAMNLGHVVGPQGPQGPQGDGADINVLSGNEECYNILAQARRSQSIPSSMNNVLIDETTIACIAKGLTRPGTSQSVPTSNILSYDKEYSLTTQSSVSSFLSDVSSKIQTNGSTSFLVRQPNIIGPYGVYVPKGATMMVFPTAPEQINFGSYFYSGGSIDYQTIGSSTRTSSFTACIYSNTTFFPGSTTKTNYSYYSSLRNIYWYAKSTNLTAKTQIARFGKNSSYEYFGDFFEMFPHLIESMWFETASTNGVTDIYFEGFSMQKTSDYFYVYFTPPAGCSTANGLFVINLKIKL